MAQPHPGPGESPPADSSPPASQGGSSDGGADVASMEDVVHMLEELKESVKELGKDVAEIKEQTGRNFWITILAGPFTPVAVFLGICLFLKDLKSDKKSFTAWIVGAK